MSEKRYSLGLDFGTLSARAVLADVDNGKLFDYESIFIYPHAIIKNINGNDLPSHYALQHPQDYIDALEFLLSDILEKTGVKKESVIGIGIDFTDCTVLPVNDKMIPLCFLKKYENEPHAYAKLWKHHAKEKYATKVSDVALCYDPKLLSITGDRMTSEFLIPKLYEIFCEAPDVYASTYKFISAGDFVASLLIGKKFIHSKAFSAKQHINDEKAPSKDFFAMIDEGFATVYDEKTVTKLSSVESPVGTLCDEWAIKTGLSLDVAISAPIIDAHSAISAAGIEEGRAVMALGTSAVFEIATAQRAEIKGALASSYESVANKLTTIEAGLAAMGDLFDWFIKNCVPAEYALAAEKQGLGIHKYLRSLAQNQKIGEHGLLALDWWNGSRSIVLDNKLSGMIVGMRLSTRPEDIYRALIESTVFGIRRIFDSFKQQGIAIESVYATGGIALKDPMLMQICADVLDTPVYCLESLQATALGSAIYGAVAAGAYSSVSEASQNMRRPIAKIYQPIKENHAQYEKIYSHYLCLNEYFSTDTPIMEFLADNR